jgi:hypothetical protein
VDRSALHLSGHHVRTCQYYCQVPFSGTLHHRNLSCTGATCPSALPTDYLLLLLSTVSSRLRNRSSILLASVRYPINYEADLQTYASRVAGTVAELCLELVYHHSRTPTSDSQRQRLIQAGGRMGIALQYVNIARDITVDAYRASVLTNKLVEG